MGAYQNDKQRWNFCSFIGALRSASMTSGGIITRQASWRNFAPWYGQKDMVPAGNLREMDAS